MLGRVPRAVGRRLAPRLNLSDTVLALGISPLGLPPTPCDLTLVADHGHDLPMVKLTRQDPATSGSPPNPWPESNANGNPVTGRATNLNRCCRESVWSLRAVRPIVENDRTARTSAALRRGTVP